MSESNPAELLSGFPVTIDLPVQWGDQDAIGHVNNIVLFRWFESARIAFLEHLSAAPTVDSEGLGFILAANQCNYRRQISYPDTVRVGARVRDFGTSSFTFELAVVSLQQEAIAADGAAVMVAFDYKANRSRPLPEELKREIHQLQGT